eukprot:2859849-Pyramimonas_sp.AAC.1
MPHGVSDRMEAPPSGGEARRRAGRHGRLEAASSFATSRACVLDLPMRGLRADQLPPRSSIAEG